MPNTNASYSLSLGGIASWYSGTCSTDKPEIRASVPLLQRGLVWRPQQIELLWDSIFRGFPIGAFVVCKKINAQQRGTGEGVTHHLLDGQQRCNAIALGFTDPFPENGSTSSQETSSIIWLDLQPQIDINSSREYLVRVTTRAHPWGYAENDGADVLSTNDIRTSLKNIPGIDPSCLDYTDKKRFLLYQLFPHRAKTPIPLAWLLIASQYEDEEAFWGYIRQRVFTTPLRPPWIRIRAFLELPVSEEQHKRIYKGIMRAKSAHIIALNAPDELLEVSQREKISREDQENIANIEHLFQRLNQQGTRLDGEDLAYSMIKAYWPELAIPIDKIARGRMPESRMVAIGIRAALAENETEHLPTIMGIGQIRAMAKGDDEKSKAKKERIYNFINDPQKGLLASCELVDTWLRYDATTNPNGLLPVHVASIARSSPDVYLLLLCFAEQLISVDTAPEIYINLCMPMQGLATILHWFAVDKVRAANLLYKQCIENLTNDHIGVALRIAIATNLVHPLYTPAEVDKFINLPESDFEKWQWWWLVQGNVEKEKAWWNFLSFRGNRELLLYAQRDFLATRFSDYDPAQRDLWEGRNRPWDFDHILAAKYLYNRKDGGKFKGVCDQWVSTIGNLRAWPFEDNRSDQAQSAHEKITDEELISRSFLVASELDGFNGGDKVRGDEVAARAFVATCRQRLLRIYEEWYKSVEIAKLISPL